MTDMTMQTTFEELRSDIVNQFIARAEERTGKQVVILWIDQSLMSDMIKNMSCDVEPVLERELIAAGRIGSFDYDDGAHSINGSPGHPVELRTAAVKDHEARKGMEQMWGVDSEGNTLFMATRRVKLHLRKAQ